MINNLSSFITNNRNRATFVIGKVRKVCAVVVFDVTFTIVIRHFPAFTLDFVIIIELYVISLLYLLKKLKVFKVIDIVDNAGFSYFSLGTLEELGDYTLSSYLDELKAMPAYRVVPASEMAGDFDGAVNLDNFDCCVEFSNPQQPGSAVQFLLWDVDDFKDFELLE